MYRIILILFLNLCFDCNAQNYQDTSFSHKNDVIIGNNPDIVIWCPVFNLNNCVNNQLRILIENCNRYHQFSRPNEYLFYSKVQDYGYSIIVKPIEIIPFYEKNIYGCFRLYNKTFYCIGNKPKDLFSTEIYDSIAIIERNIETNDSVNNFPHDSFSDLNTKEIEINIIYKQLQYKFIIQPCTSFLRKEIKKLKKTLTN